MAFFFFKPRRGLLLRWSSWISRISIAAVRCTWPPSLGRPKPCLGGIRFFWGERLGNPWDGMGISPYTIWIHMKYDESFFFWIIKPSQNPWILMAINFTIFSRFFLDGFMINRGMDPVNPKFFEEICWDFLWPGFTKGFFATHRKTQQTVADGKHSSVERMGWIGWSFCAWTWFWF